MSPEDIQSHVDRTVAAAVEAAVERAFENVVPRLERMSEEAAEKVAHRVLTKFGVDVGNPREAQADLIYLRDWRLSVERMKSRGIMAITGSVAIFLLGAVALGIKSILSGG